MQQFTIHCVHRARSSNYSVAFTVESPQAALTRLLADPTFAKWKPVAWSSGDSCSVLARLQAFNAGHIIEQSATGSYVLHSHGGQRHPVGGVVDCDAQAWASADAPDAAAPMPRPRGPRGPVATFGEGLRFGKGARHG